MRCIFACWAISISDKAIAISFSVNVRAVVVLLRRVRRVGELYAQRPRPSLDRRQVLDRGLKRRCAAADPAVEGKAVSDRNPGFPASGRRRSTPKRATKVSLLEPPF